MDFDPIRYDRWYATTLGRRVLTDERRLLLSLGEFHSGQRVLELGCGTGAFSGPVHERTGRLVGLDRSEAMLEAARRRYGERPGLSWKRGDAAALPFAEASFDVVLAVTMLGLMAEPEQVIKEAFRVLVPGGRLVIGELNGLSVWAWRRRLKGRLTDSTLWSQARFFTSVELERMLKTAGFDRLTAQGAVWYPPLQSETLPNLFLCLERMAPSWGKYVGAFVVVRGDKPSN